MRARLLSFVSVPAALSDFVAYGGKRGWLLPESPAPVCSLATSRDGHRPRGLRLRVYSSVRHAWFPAFAEWIAHLRRLITVMVVSCVLGTYTLPFYVVFGGGLLLLSFLFRPSRKTFLAGFLSAVAILMLYLPIITKIYSVFGGYAERYKTTFFSSFQSIDGVFFALQYFFPREVIEIGADQLPSPRAGALLCRLRRFAEKSDRPLRASRFRSLPSWHSALLPDRPCGWLHLAARWRFSPFDHRARSCQPAACASASVGSALHTAHGSGHAKSEVVQPLVPRADWRDLGVLIERAFSKDTRIWLAGESPALLQWNLSSAKPENGPRSRGTPRRKARRRGGEPNHRMKAAPLARPSRGSPLRTSPFPQLHRTLCRPWRSGIASIVVNDQRWKPVSPDASLIRICSRIRLAWDVLRPKNAGEANGESPRRFGSRQL